MSDKTLGLNRIGPNPWDYEYNPAKGQRVTFIDLDGTSLTGVITDFVEDEQDGTLSLTVAAGEE